MINFRYHLVSMAAVLLALAAGVALGSGPLDSTGSTLRGEPQPATTGIDPALASFESSYAGLTSKELLKGILAGQSVVVLTVPGSSSAEVRGITANLKAAGAEVTGEVGLSGKLLDSSGRQFAEGVAQQAASDVPGVTAEGDSYARIGAAIGRALLNDKTSKVDPTATTITSAFAEGGLLSMTKAPKKRATLAVLVTAPESASGEGQSNVIAELVGSLDAAGQGVVVAGPASSSTSNGAVKAVRDSKSAGEVSTVDVTDTAAGQVITALVAAREADGRSGAWGTSRSADGAIPN